MENSYNIKNLAKSSRYNFWVGVFVAFCLVTAGIFYYATQKIEYIWRWNRVPIYFAYKDEIDITSEVDGEVESIEGKAKEAIITVKGLDGSESYTVPAESVNVKEGELISVGDTLARYKEWKPGLLVIGLWITLQVSVMATIFGILIGVIGGLMRISSNPALKWITIAYVEVIRGSPLMVQILIWYFVLGTVIKLCRGICHGNRKGGDTVHPPRPNRSRPLPWYDIRPIHAAHHSSPGVAPYSPAPCRTVYQPDKRLIPFGNDRHS
jgi:polar amino acid transport system permease protein